MTAPATMPRERPILFSGPMVRAILDGSKTQTRRIVRIDDTPVLAGANVDFERWRGTARGIPTNAQNVRMLGGDYLKCDAPPGSETVSARVLCPYGEPGDRLWVRETFALIWPGEAPPEDARECRVEYRADGDEGRFPGEWPPESKGDPGRPRWRPSIHMPRWASRITLEITSVRVRRLQAITEEDARAEGFPLPGTPCSYVGRCNSSRCPAHHARASFAALWDEINGARAPWASNPWVWVVEFRREVNER